MKQQINPGIAITVVLGVLLVIGLVIYVSNKTAAPPTAATKGAPPTMSPDQQLQQHIQKIQQGGQAGAPGGNQ